jgi:hypothetical protein
LPRLAAIFDQATPQSFFKGSKVDALEDLSMTETQLLEQTAGLLGLTLPQLVRAGALVYAKREFLNHKKFLSPASSTPEDLPRSGSGVAGVADLRIQAAYDALLASKNPITPAKLATRALTGYPTALRWLKIHHPELLTPKQPTPAPAPEAAPAAAPKPDTAAAAPTTQEVPQPQQTQTAKRKRTAPVAKAKPLPKKLRNPKNHPDLLADKNALKQPEAAKSDHDTAKAQKPAKHRRNPENMPF